MKKLEYLGILMLFLAIGIFIFRGLELKKEKEKYDLFVGEGNSMLPTFADGDALLVDTKAEIKENDIIVFNCLRCNLDKHDTSSMVKRLIKKNKSGCFWVEGDNTQVSLDSRDKRIGWLCPKDIEVFGVVEKVVNEED
jgi:signal peptidase I